MNEQTTGALRWTLRSVRREILYIVLLPAVQSALSACGIGYALLMRNVIDAAVTGVMGDFVRCILWFAGLLLTQIALRAVLRWEQEVALSAVENRLKGRLFACLMGKDYAKVTAVHSGEWLNRMQSDVRTVAEGICVAMPQMVGTAMRLMGAAAMILVLETRLGLVLIPCGLLAGAFAWLFRRKLKVLHKDSQEKEGAVRIFMQEALGSLMVVKAFGREADVQRQNESHMHEHMRARLRRNRFSNACNVGFGAAMQSAYLMGLTACGLGILNGTMTYGTCMALMQLVGQIQSPLVSITGLMPKMISALGSAERLMEAEQLRSDGAAERAPYDAKEYYEKKFSGLAMRDIVFSYEEDGQERRVYSGLNLEINKGDCAAVTGPSGCGKSTLLKLLMCLYAPESGQRLMLEKGGTRELTAADRCLFAYVPQGNHLLGGSIRQALTFGDEKAMRDEKRLVHALDAACALDFVQGLENGLDTVLGERGQGLSEGQLQRLAIARAVCSARPILLLDECTSALDEETEARLLEKLRAMTDKTIVIVTHRPRALTVCNRRVEMRAQDQ